MNKNELPDGPGYAVSIAAMIVFSCGLMGGWIILYCAAVKLVGAFTR